ncbi:MAG: hypothetical protein ACXWFZ_10440 [Nitrososphaeraceae archaeon]
MQQEQQVSELKIKILLLKERYEQRVEVLTELKLQSDNKIVANCLGCKMLELTDVVKDLKELLK